ncbi:MAG: hypothetical protein MJH10_11760 [Epibacterium sp.]|nr:hypothetical protein [Epibacterium sp.]NQX74222.1 hypothetical protein [Epibacterium sp.]
MSKTKYHDCDCVDVGCDVLKTSQEIPTVVVKNSKPLIRVRTFDGHILHYVTPNRQKHNKHSETLSDAPAYYIQNGKLIVWNTFDFKAIMVEGVFEDPTELSNISICNSDGDVYSQCTYDVNAQPFPINDKLLDRMMSEALRRILGIYNVPNDIVNEGNSNV